MSALDWIRDGRFARPIPIQMRERGQPGSPLSCAHEAHTGEVSSIHGNTRVNASNPAMHVDSTNVGMPTMQDAQGVWFVCVVGVTSTTMLDVNAIVPRGPEGVPTPCEHAIGFEKGDLHVPYPFRWVTMGARVRPPLAPMSHTRGKCPLFTATQEETQATPQCT